MAKRNDTLKGYGKSPEEYTWHYEMANSAKNSMGAGKVTRYTSTDGTVTGKFQYLVTDEDGAQLSNYTVNGTVVSQVWKIPPGAVFGPFKYLTSFTITGTGQVLAFEPEL